MIQGTPEWLEFRKTKIEASDAPCIMGVGFNTPYQLWNIKRGDIEVKDNMWMKRGRELEQSARKGFEIRTGLRMFPETLIGKKHDWMLASMDGITMEHDAAVEIKCPGKYDHNLAQKGTIPLKYIPQLQHQIRAIAL